MTRPTSGPTLTDVLIILISPALVALHMVAVGLGVLVLGLVRWVRGEE